MEDCIFCKIIKGEIPSFTIYEDDKFKVIADRFPGNIGHCLIVPKNHINDIFEMDPKTASELFALAVKISKILKTNLSLEGLNILQNNGEIAGQTVFHFHMHLIPRYKEDNVTIRWKALDPPAEVFEDLLKKIGKIPLD